jgi:hypothetical protein
MKGLLCVLILFAVSAVFAQNPAPTARPPEPYHIKNDVLGEPISVYRQNNPECSDKDPITESANFYQAKTYWNVQIQVLPGGEYEVGVAEETTNANRGELGRQAREADFSQEILTLHSS